jgi:hypothetical protein
MKQTTMNKYWRGGGESKFGDTGETLPTVKPPDAVRVGKNPENISDICEDSESGYYDLCEGYHDWEECAMPGYKRLQHRSCSGCEIQFRHHNDGIEGGKDCGFWPSEKHLGYYCRKEGCVAMCAICKRANDVKSPIQKRRRRG